MYEDKTYEAILQEKLARVASSLDKREGSIIFDALAPNSLESAMIYVALDTVLNETFADTASRDYLIMRCAERGITPLPATCAVGVGEFSMDIPVGTRFSCDKYNWTVTEKIESLKYYLTCETAGADPNGYTGQLIFADIVIIGAVLLVSCKYIKEAFEKFVAILNANGKTEDTQEVSTNE